MADYIFLIESRLSSDQLTVLTRIQELAQKQQVNLYLAGGAVRDLVCGYPIRDLDFIVEGSGTRLARALNKDEVETIELDETLRAAEVTFRSGVPISVSMARSEAYAKPTAPPEIRPATVFEDLRRRDFAVNAIAISLNPASRGLLLDPTNGLADIEKRELRVLHNYSFIHDPVRMLRIVRFAVRLGFRIEPKSAELLRTGMERKFYEMITPDALGYETRELAKEDNPVSILRALESHGLLNAFHARLAKRHPDYVGLARFLKYRRAVQQVGHRLDSLPGFVFYLLHRLKPRERANVLRRIGLRKAEFRRLLGWEKEARRVAKMLHSRRTAAPMQVYKYLASVPLDLLVFTQSYHAQKKVQSKIRNFLTKYLPLRKALPVRELEALGVPRGPKFDHILEQLFQAQLEGKAKTRLEQVRLLRKLAGLPKAEAKPARKGKAAPPAKKAKKAGAVKRGSRARKRRKK